MTQRRTIASCHPRKSSVWKIVYTSLVLLCMFLALVSDRIGADLVMAFALTALLAASIISVPEALAGFPNEGLLTVLVLFVVAAGISHIEALDWYMGKLLGTPRTETSTQLRLMVPIALISGFLNNTPVVAVMIPIVQRWGAGLSAQKITTSRKLLIPLSFASILGGTCTLIGTSINLVVVGLLQARYSGTDDEDVGTVGLFDLGQYGVPVALVGMIFVLIASSFILPDGTKVTNGSTSDDGRSYPANLDGNIILLGARLTKWSGAAGRSVKRSGLRDTGGLYLVSVHRAATENVHHRRHTMNN